MRLAFDIESNGLLHQLDTIHCIIAQDVDTGEIFRGNTSNTNTSIESVLEVLSCADEIIGHNILSFDIPAIRKVYPSFTYTGKVVDTLVASKIIYPHRKELDFDLFRSGVLPGKLIGRHSLESWGHRLGDYKGDFGKDFDWVNSVWSGEMQEYCEQDTYLTVNLFKHLQSFYWPVQALELEHELQQIINDQEAYGVAFNERGALTLFAELSAQRQRLTEQLQEVFKPIWVFSSPVTPKVTLNYADPLRADRTAGAPFTRIEREVFNPASRPQIAKRLQRRYDWKPSKFTETGQPMVDEAVLDELPYPEAKLLSEYMMLNKRIGQLAEGDESWLNHCGADGRIHGRVNISGTGTGRATHNKPNMSQVPANDKPWGKRCRELFGPPPGYVQVGIDVSGLELRMLAHFMARYDGGQYADIVVNGDVHTHNQKAAGLASRALAKTFYIRFFVWFWCGKPRQDCWRRKNTWPAVNEKVSCRSSCTETIKGAIRSCC